MGDCPLTVPVWARLEGRYTGPCRIVGVKGQATKCWNRGLVMANESGCNRNLSLGRREFLAVGAGSVAAMVGGTGYAQETAAQKVVTPPAGKRLLLACKLGMIPKEIEGKK